MTVNESMLQLAVDALAAGYELTGFAPVEDMDGKPNGHEAQCRNCGQIAWADYSGMMYILLADSCPNGERREHG